MNRKEHKRSMRLNAAIDELSAGMTERAVISVLAFKLGYWAAGLPVDLREAALNNFDETIRSAMNYRIEKDGGAP